jgi:hypothetical protein
MKNTLHRLSPDQAAELKGLWVEIKPSLSTTVYDRALVWFARTTVVLTFNQIYMMSVHVAKSGAVLPEWVHELLMRDVLSKQENNLKG